MKNSWIKPSGEVIEAHNHNKYASDLLDEKMGVEGAYDYMEKENIDYPYQVLHLWGWVRVGVRSGGNIDIMGDCIDLTRAQRNTIDPKMTPAQIRTAKKLCVDSCTLFHEAINDKRFWQN